MIRQTANEFLLKAQMTNGQSVNYELELVLNRKDNTLKVYGKNGEPDFELEKIKR